jgi:hypothetical protein
VVFFKFSCKYYTAVYIKMEITSIKEWKKADERDEAYQNQENYTTHETVSGWP